MTDAELYRARMETAMENLAIALKEAGADLCDGGLDDEAIVELATRKVNMLIEIAGTVLTPGLLKAAMRG